MLASIVVIFKLSIQKLVYKTTILGSMEAVKKNSTEEGVHYENPENEL